jgi:hypothetical protein
VSGLLHVPSALPPGKETPLPIGYEAGWGPRAGLNDVEKRKFLTLPWHELRSLGHPASIQSLYRLRYPGSLNSKGYKSNHLPAARQCLSLIYRSFCPTYLLTYGAEPFLRSCQLCSHSGTFPAILRNSKVHHRVHKSPPVISILSYIDPVRTIPFYFSQGPPTCVSVFLVVSFLLGFSPISYIHSSSLPFVLHALPISSSST